MLSIRTDKNQVPCLLYSISFRNIPTIKDATRNGKMMLKKKTNKVIEHRKKKQ